MPQALKQQAPSEFLPIDGIDIPQAVFSDRAAFIALARAGLSGAVVRQAVAVIGHRELFVRLLETTPGNLSRFYRRKALGQAQSESLLDLLRVFARAQNVFGDMATAREWMDATVPALGMQRPIDLCDSFEGRAMVVAALHKIEFGEFA